MKHIHPSRTLRSSFTALKKMLFIGALLAAAHSVRAADIYKADNTTALNVASAWTNNLVPGAADIAVWDSNVTAANATNVLGANLTWSGIRITNPGGLVQINSGNSLTNGAAGIDMSAATQDLNLSNAVVLSPSSLQIWNIGVGRTLTLGAVPNKSANNNSLNGGAVQVNTTGTVRVSGIVAGNTVIVDTQGNPFVTYGPSDWAALDGSGNFVPAVYTGNMAATAAGNNDVISSYSVGTVDVSSTRFNDPANLTLTITGTSTHTARGILVTPNSGGGTITGGNLRPSRASTAGVGFEVIQNSAADFTIASTLAVASSGTPVNLVKSGPGNLNLSSQFNAAGGINANGGITINGGKLTATITGSLGAGFVRVNSGGLQVNSGVTAAGAGGVTIASGATNGVQVLAANGQAIYNGLTFNAGTSYLRVGYNNGVSFSTTTAPILVTNLNVNGTVNVMVLSGNASVGIFPLLRWTNAISGPAFANFNLITLPLRVSGYLSNDTANSSIDLVITNVNQPVTWAVGNATWDINSTANWKDTLSASTTYQQANGLGDAVRFDDTASGISPITVTLNASPVPASVTVAATKNYTISGNGSISGTGGLTKTNSGTLTLATTNSFAGGIALNGGLTSFSTLSNLGSGAISFGGGTLQYASGNVDDISVRTVTLGAGGGTIDVGANTVTFANPIGNGGAGGLTKTGSGPLALTGTNRYSGNTVISQGTLTLNANTYISNSAAIVVNSGTTLDTFNSGVNLALGSVANQVLAGSGIVLGNVTAGAGTWLTPGTNGVISSLSLSNDLTISGGSLVYDVNSAVSHDTLIVQGNVTITGGALQVNNGVLVNGIYKIIQYSGSLLSGAGSSGNLTVTNFSQAGKSVSLSDAIPGEIDLVVSTLGGTNITWQGDGGNNFWDVETSLNWTNGSGTPVFFVSGDKVKLDDTSPNTTINLEATVQPGSVTVNGTQSYTLQTAVNGKIGGTGTLTNNSTGPLIILTANNSSGTIQNNGTIQVGNNTAPAADIGTGNIINNGALIFQQLDDRSVPGQVSGSGSLLQSGVAVLTLSGNNSYSGPTTVGSGVLQIGTGGASGTMGSGAISNSGTIVFNRSGNLNVSNIKAGPSGGGTVAFVGSGTATLSGVNTWENNTFISNGIVKLANAQGVPNGGTTTGWLILDGGAAAAGRFDLNGFDQAINALSGLGNTVNGVITNGGASGTNILTIGTTGTANTYSGTIADSPAGAKTTVTLRGTGSLRLNNNSPFGGGVFVGDTATLNFANGANLGNNGNLTLSNGTTLFLRQAGGAANCGNNIIIPDGQAANFTSDALGNGVTANVNGGSLSTNVILTGPGLTYANLNSKQLQNFLGTVEIQPSSTLRFFNNVGTLNGGDNTTFQVDAGGTLFIRSGGVVFLGALVGSGAIGNGSSLGTLVIGTKGLSTTFSGTVGTLNTLSKTGNGRLTFDGAVVVTNTDNLTFTNYLISSATLYTGTTTISNGVLQFVAPNIITSSPAITLMSPTAVLDASLMGYVSNQIDPNTLTPTNSIIVTNGTIEIVASNTLNGIGTIRGSVLADANSTLNPGNTAGVVTTGTGTGVLNVTNVASIFGLVNMRLNNTNAVNADELTANSFAIDPGASLNVTNVGPAFQGGEVFQLFNHPVNFSTVTLPTVAPPLYLTNRLAIDGSITIGGVSSTPPNMKFSVSGTSLNISWPPNHLGWTLQTNGVSLTQTNQWFPYPGSQTTTNVSIPILQSKSAVYFRLTLQLP